MGETMIESRWVRSALAAVVLLTVAVDAADAARRRSARTYLRGGDHGSQCPAESPRLSVPELTACMRLEEWMAANKEHYASCQPRDGSPAGIP